MFERILIYVKHRLVFLWIFIDWVNNQLFKLFHKSSLDKTFNNVLKNVEFGEFAYRHLCQKDMEQLMNLILAQNPDDLKYFKPHKFDAKSLVNQLNKSGFLMMGVFNGEVIIGYFFLRFFANKKCFVGRLIDKEYRGKGIGDIMNRIMYNIAWRMNFRCLSTISKNNKAVIGAHKNNSNMIVLKELQNDYLLVEFEKKHIGLSSVKREGDKEKSS